MGRIDPQLLKTELLILDEWSLQSRPAAQTRDIVIYESTVYPGCTEEDCVPILERESGLAYISAESRPDAAPTRAAPNVGGAASSRDPAQLQGFYVGYSPERINPSDKEHRAPTPEIAGTIDAHYREIITAGTHRAESIRVAEAAKVIENTHCDPNIALMNELSVLFTRIGIDTEAVLRAADIKWNFLPFRPGLVGGHCISVDSYYLAETAERVGYIPQIILAGRPINTRFSTRPAKVAHELARTQAAFISAAIPQESAFLLA